MKKLILFSMMLSSHLMADIVVINKNIWLDTQLGFITIEKVSYPTVYLWSRNSDRSMIKTYYLFNCSKKEYSKYTTQKYIGKTVVYTIKEESLTWQSISVTPKFDQLYKFACIRETADDSN